MKNILKKLAVLLCGIALLLVTMLGCLTMIDILYNAAFGKNAVYIISGNLSGLPIWLSVAFVIVLVFLFSPVGIRNPFCEEDSRKKDNKEKGIKAKFSLKKKIKIAGISLGILIFGSLISILWYEKFTPQGVETFCFGVQKSYTWQEAESLTLKQDSQDMFVFQVTMKDGTKHQFNGGFFRQAEYFSDAFEEEFEDGDGYMYWVSRTLKDHGIPLEIKNPEKLLKDLGKEGDYWTEVAEEIIKIYEE